MTLEQVRRYCMSLPHTTEQVQWGSDLVFKIGGKMYAVVNTEPAPVFMSFQSTPDDFAELTERPNIIPAPYMARHHWVALQDKDAIPSAELKQRLKLAYELCIKKLPKKTQAALGSRKTQARRPVPLGG